MVLLGFGHSLSSSWSKGVAFHWLQDQLWEVAAGFLDKLLSASPTQAIKVLLRCFLLLDDVFQWQEELGRHPPHPGILPSHHPISHTVSITYPWMITYHYFFSSEELLWDLFTTCTCPEPNILDISVIKTSLLMLLMQSLDALIADSWLTSHKPVWNVTDLQVFFASLDSCITLKIRLWWRLLQEGDAAINH